MSAIDDWIDVIRREVQHGISQTQRDLTCVCTGYNPKTHAIKGILMPHGVETGWMPLSPVHAGNNFGIYVGPKAGSAEAYDGDQFDVGFDTGDPNNPVARHKQSSTADQPPEVQSGEVLLKHEGGSQIFFDKDKNLTFTGPDGKNSSMKLDADGNGTVSAGGATALVDKDGCITLTDASGGVVYVSSGKIHLGSKTAAIAVQTVAGPSTKVFAVV